MTSGRFCHVFATPLGSCGLAWGGGGLVGASLPGTAEEAGAERLAIRFRATPTDSLPRAVAEAVAGIRALMAGADERFAGIALDMDGVPDFHRRVYERARLIPPGRTATYGEIARDLGEAGAARAVGQALGRNPFPIIVPCHRVLGAGDNLGGFSAPGGRDTKLRLLALEGLDLRPGPSLFEHAGLAP